MVWNGQIGNSWTKDVPNGVESAFLVTRCLNKYFQSQWQWLKFETFEIIDIWQTFLLDKLWQIDFKNIFVLRGAWTWVTNWPRRFQPIFETKLLGQNFWVLQNPIKRARPIWVGHNTLLHFIKLNKIQQNSQCMNTLLFKYFFPKSYWYPAF